MTYTDEQVSDPISLLTPHRALLDQLLDKWSIPVLERLCGQPMRFNALRRSIPEVTQKSLVATLRRLERNGVVERFLVSDRPVAVEYRITTLGKTLRDPVDALLGWVATHLPEVHAAQVTFDERDEAHHFPGLAAAGPQPTRA